MIDWRRLNHRACYQIIGRGTRINEDFGKFYFTIMDFRNVTALFADKAFDGDPVRVKEVSQAGDISDTDDEADDTPIIDEWTGDEIDFPEPEKPDISIVAEDPPGKERRRKVSTALARRIRAGCRQPAERQKHFWLCMYLLLVALLVVPSIVSLVRFLCLTLWVEVLRVAQVAVWIWGVILDVAIFSHRHYSLWQLRRNQLYTKPEWERLSVEIAKLPKI